MNARRRKHRAENIEQVNTKIKWMTCPVCNDYPIQSKNYKAFGDSATSREFEEVRTLDFIL